MTTASYTLHASVETAELRISDVGKLIVFRPLLYKEGDPNGKIFINKNEEDEKKKAHIGVVASKHPEYEQPCPGCKFVSSLQLNQPFDELVGQIEETLSEKLVVLHEAALLEE